jgi:hypothetical protein
VDEQMIDLDRPSMVVGRRREGSDIVIHDTNVSRKHALIESQGDRVTIEDTNSSNGTVVNDERIEARVDLRPGDVIRIGDAVFVFEQVEAPLGSPEGSTMAIDLDSPMTSLGGAPELVAPGLTGGPMGPLTPPPAIMEPPRQTALSDNFLSSDPEPASAANASGGSSAASAGPSTPPKPSTSSPSSGGGNALPGGSAFTGSGPSSGSSSSPSGPKESSWSASSSASSDAGPPGGASLSPLTSEPAWSSGSSKAPEPKGEPLPSTGPRAESIDALRSELSEVGSELVGFAGTLGGLAERVERLEQALDDASGDLNRVSEAVRGPDATVLRELQGILDEIEHDGNAGLDEAMRVLEQLSAQPRDIELLLKLSQQAGAIESALRIHGRLVAIAPRVRASLARLVG